MNWAWGIELPPAMKLVLLKLADRANDNGECWPGMGDVAATCGISKASLIRYLKKLDDMGLVQVIHRKGEDGKQQTNMYWLNMEWKPGVNLQPGDGEPGCNWHDNRVAMVQPDKELKLFIEPTVETTDATTTVASPEPIAPDPVRYDGVKWEIDNAVYDQWVHAYSNGRTASDTEDWIEMELAKASIWLQANPRKRKKNYLRFLTGWLTRAADATKHRAYPQPRRPYH